MNDLERLNGVVFSLRNRVQELEGNLAGVMRTEKVSIAIAADYRALKTLCDFYGVRVEEAQSGSREERVVRARHAIMVRMAEDHKWEVPRICRALLCTEKTVREALKGKKTEEKEEKV